MIKKFFETANLFHKYHKTNQITKANACAKKMNKIINEVILQKDYKSFFDNVLASNNSIAMIWICDSCIELGYRKQEAINLLYELEKSKDEIISRDAHMLLYVKTAMCAI